MSNYSQIYSIERKFAFSTTTPLGAAGVYTSPTIDAINYKQLNFLVTSDVSGTYFIQHSDDGITWYNGTVTATALSAAAINITLQIVYFKYIRFIFTNGATIQGNFKFGGYLSPL